MLRKLAISLVLMAAVLTLGGVLAAVLIRTRPTAARVSYPNRPLRVEAVRLTLTTVVEPLIGYGTVEADRRASLKAEVAAVVRQRVADVRAGSAVQAGQVLVRLDDRDFVERAEQLRQMIAADDALLAELDVQKNNSEQLLEIEVLNVRIAADEEARVRGLFERDLAPKRELDLARMTLQGTRRQHQTLANELALIEPRRLQVEAQRAGHQRELAIAETNIQRCEIRAPFAGTITVLAVEVGQLVPTGGLVAEVLATDRVEIPVALPASLRSRLSLGAQARLCNDSNPARRWEGTVERIAGQADEQTRTFHAYIMVENTDPADPLMPGIFVRAEVAGPTLRDVLLVPRPAIRDQQVFIAVDGHAEKRQVVIDRYLPAHAVVADGVSAGDWVILTNLDRLHPGMAVQVTNGRLAAAP